MYSHFKETEGVWVGSRMWRTEWWWWWGRGEFHHSQRNRDSEPAHQARRRFGLFLCLEALEPCYRILVGVGRRPLTADSLTICHEAARAQPKTRTVSVRSVPGVWPVCVGGVGRNLCCQLRSS